MMHPSQGDRDLEQGPVTIRALRSLTSVKQRSSARPSLPCQAIGPLSTMTTTTDISSS